MRKLKQGHTLSTLRFIPQLPTGAFRHCHARAEGRENSLRAPRGISELALLDIACYLCMLCALPRIANFALRSSSCAKVHCLAEQLAHRSHQPVFLTHAAMEWQTMSIASAGPSTLASAGESMLRTGTLAPNRNPLDVSDVFGAAPRAPAALSKPEFAMNTVDIEGARPAQLHGRFQRGRQREELQVRNVPRAVSQRHSNPMEPAYDWDVRQHASAPEFAPQADPLRRTLDVSDIAGAAPLGSTSRAGCDRPGRQGLDASDIPGAAPRRRTSRAAQRDAADVSDIAGAAPRKAGLLARGTQRMTDPLRPVHIINGMEIGDDLGSQPKPRTKSRNEPFFSLCTQDIEGATPGSKPKDTPSSGLPIDQRRHWRNTNFIQDIPGAQAGTRRRGIATNRVTDPNLPLYGTLDGRRAHRRQEDPVEQYAARLADPRDAEIAELRRTVEELKTIVRYTPEHQPAAAASPASEAAARAEEQQLQAEAARLRAQLSLRTEDRASAGAKQPAAASRPPLHTRTAAAAAAAQRREHPAGASVRSGASSVRSQTFSRDGSTRSAGGLSESALLQAGYGAPTAAGNQRSAAGSYRASGASSQRSGAARSVRSSGRQSEKFLRQAHARYEADVASVRDLPDV